MKTFSLKIKSPSTFKSRRLDLHLSFCFFIIIMICLTSSCKKLVAISPPVNSITTSEVFIDSANANSAIEGIYSNLEFANHNQFAFGNCAITLTCGQSADELIPLGSTEVSTNTLVALQGNTDGFWTQGYSYLYQANAVIGNVEGSPGISNPAKTQFIAEAKFIRAFIYYYLVNLYGDVPLVTTTDYQTNKSASRAPVKTVYQQILSDLLDAQKSLREDYFIGGGERIRANKWCATALLARVYLFLGDWKDAEIQASNIISNTELFNLQQDLNGVFLKNNTEAILQWQNNSSTNKNTYNATAEGYNLIPYDATTQPYLYLTDELLNSFEANDKRKIAWIDSTVYAGMTYYYPYKYKVGASEMTPNGTVTEYYTVLRLAEQYLIRAEARANGAGTGLTGAISDLNVIRNRAGLNNYSGSSTDANAVLKAIYHENRIEYFAEWGHRWFDLKRTGQAHPMLSIIPYKMPWIGDFQLLYPIPPNEIQDDPELKQNPGY